MTEEHPFIDDIPAYALGALDTADAQGLEAHLQGCEMCRAELASYRALNEILLTSTPPQPPPAMLRRRLQERLPSARKAAHPKQAWTFSFNQFALGLGVVLLLAFNVLSFIQTQSLQRQQAQLASQLATSQTTIAMLAYPETKSLPIHEGSIAGALLLDRERNIAVLLAWNLPELKANQTFQIWLIDPQGKRTSAGIFKAQPELPFTSAPLHSPGSLLDYVGIGVTVEPAGGSNQPTGQRLFTVNF